MPPKGSKKAAAVAVATSVDNSAVESVIVTAEGTPQKSPEKKKPVAAKKTTTPKAKANGVAKEEKPKAAAKKAAAPKNKKTPKKEENAVVSSEAEGSPKKTPGSPKKAPASPKKASSGGESSPKKSTADSASPKKKPAAKKRTKAVAGQDSVEESSGADVSPAKKAKVAAKPKKAAKAAGDEPSKSPKKRAPAKPRKGKETQPQSGSEESSGSPKKKTAAKKKADKADGAEPAAKKPRKKKDTTATDGEVSADGAEPVKEKKKAAPKKKKVAEGADGAVAADGSAEEKPKKVAKPRAKKPKPEDDGAPVVSTRTVPVPKAMPTLLKKPVIARNKSKKATSEEDDMEEEEDKVEKGKPKKLQNKSETDWENQNLMINQQFQLKIASWNVSGLRAWLEKGGKNYLVHDRPDIVCLQETKCKLESIPEEAAFTGYHTYWLGFGGQAGVGIYSRKMPINVTYGIGDKEMDSEGRLMTAEYEKYFLVNVYVPNSGRKLVTMPKRMQWNKLFKEYIKGLDSKKAVIICGDLNVAHEEIDLANPKTNKKTAGFTQEERDGMSDFLKEADFVDTFRHFYPDKKDAYTFWTYMNNARAKNVGWRLDYILVSKRILDKVVDQQIRSKIYGSDHCPIVGFLNL